MKRPVVIQKETYLVICLVYRHPICTIMEESFHFLWRRYIAYVSRYYLEHRWWYDKYPNGIRPLFNALRHFVGYLGHIIPYAGDQLLIAFDLIDNVLHLTPSDGIHWGCG
jgi:hypothetical protein